MHMKHLLLLLLLSPLSYSLDLSVPEEEVDWSEFEARPGEDWEHQDRKLFQINIPENPATPLQRKIFWTLAAADVWTTHRGLKEPGTYEVNPLLGKHPSLEKLIITKVVLGTIMLNNYESWEVNAINIIHVYVVHNNYSIIYD